MESFELNKILGAILGSCLVLLSVHLFADAVFSPAMPAKPGFEIAVQKESPSTAPKQTAAAEAPIATRLASADINVGKSESNICMACHNLQKGGPNEVGPNLWGVVDRPRASHPGYDYSAAMKAKGGKWTFAELDKFLTHPQGYIPGTKMTFAGFKSPKKRADIIAYLRTLSDQPASLPKAPAPANSATQPQQPPKSNSNNKG